MTRVPADFSRRPDGSEPSKVRLLSRRAALGLFGGAGAALALGPLLDRGVVLAADNLKKGGQVVVALSQEPTVFNPVRPHIEVDHGVHFGLFDSLWRVDERAQFLPNLATEVPSTKNGGIQKNGLEYTDQAQARGEVARRPALHGQGREVHPRPDPEPEVRRVHQDRPRRGLERGDPRRVHAAGAAQGVVLPLPHLVGRHLHRPRPHPRGRGRSQHRRVQHQEPGGHGTLQVRRAGWPAIISCCGPTRAITGSRPLSSG